MGWLCGPKDCEGCKSDYMLLDLQNAQLIGLANSSALQEALSQGSSRK